MNVNSIRQKVERAINKAPLEITLLRPNKVDDGCGGYIIPSDKPTVEIGTLVGILDNSRDNKVQTVVMPGGTFSQTESPVFITIWKPGLEIKKNDFFIVNGIRYTVTNPTNILNMNIYYSLQLNQEVKED